MTNKYFLTFCGLSLQISSFISEDHSAALLVLTCRSLLIDSFFFALFWGVSLRCALSADRQLLFALVLGWGVLHQVLVAACCRTSVLDQDGAQPLHCMCRVSIIGPPRESLFSSSVASDSYLIYEQKLLNFVIQIGAKKEQQLIQLLRIYIFLSTYVLVCLHFYTVGILTGSMLSLCIGTSFLLLVFNGGLF